DDSLPQYYDSEPSGQPPHYDKATSTAKRRSAQQQPQFTGASAASVAAVLASPAPEKVKKRTWRERWRELKSNSRADDENFYQVDKSSSAHWNAWGARLDGGVTKMRVLKR
ncbi:hypothetical protein K458DRAFT_298527, partial [Lentithecium fluviatile CBS 122367]